MASSIQKSPRGRSEEVGPKSKKADSIVSGSLSHCGLCRFHASLYSSWSLYCLLFRNHLMICTASPASPLGGIVSYGYATQPLFFSSLCSVISFIPIYTVIAPPAPITSPAKALLPARRRTGVDWFPARRPRTASFEPDTPETNRTEAP